MAGIVPDSILMRKTKLGFAVPGHRWLAHDLRSQVAALIEDTLRCERYVDPKVLRRWYAAPGAPTASTESYLGLFRVLSLEMWMRAFSIS